MKQYRVFIRLLTALIILITAFILFSDTTNAVTEITASGDYGQTNNTNLVIDGIGDIAPDAHLSVGDLSYGNNADTNQELDWCNYVKGRLVTKGIDTTNFPFQLVAGNHEDDVMANGYIGDFADCLPDKMSSTGVYAAHYYFDIDNIRVIMISPDLSVEGVDYSYNIGTPEYQDVNDWIDSANGSGVDWIIVGVHKACLTAGVKPTCEIGNNITDLLINKKVDLIVHGHEHMYQRSKQLSLSVGCSTLDVNNYNASCTAHNDTTNTYTKGDGPVDVIVGTGGRSLYNVNSDDTELQYFLRANGLSSNPAYGNLKLTIENDELTGEFIAARGDYNDKFLITSSDNSLLNAYDTSSDYVGDYNGDGKDDIAYCIRNGNDIVWRVALSTGKEFQYKGQWIADFGSQQDEFFIGDYNGDGKDDIAGSRVVDSDTVEWRVALSTGNSFSSKGLWINDLGNEYDSFYTGDFTGDGKDDITYSRNVTSSQTMWKVGKSTGKHFTYTGVWVEDIGNSGDNYYVGDFNNDRQTDLVYMRVNSPEEISWRVAFSTSRSFKYKGLWRADLGDSDDNFKVADVNGDHKDDITYIKSPDLKTKSIKAAISNGVNFNKYLNLTNDYGNDGDRFRIGDFNGDGKDEITNIKNVNFSVLKWKTATLHPFSDKGTWISDFGSSGYEF